MEIEYPIALDNDFEIWRAFDNQFWPALYFIDARGRIRHHEFGEGNYLRSEQVIQELLKENGSSGLPNSIVPVEASGPELAADWPDLKSVENYLGYERTIGFESLTGTKFHKPHRYEAPSHLKLNHWALSGAWTLAKPWIVSDETGARIAYQFHARDLHLVMEPANIGSGVKFQVSIDGEAPGTSHGIDVDAEGFGMADQPRMYQLIRQSGSVAERRFEISFQDPGIRAYSFTFG
jgi:hypothetical protein